MDTTADSFTIPKELELNAAPEASGSEPVIDHIPGGRYPIIERLARGPVGSVYKALDTILDRPVAVKSIRLDSPFAGQGPDELRELFVREAQVAARLQHPNIVTIHDLLATDARGFIIMEFIEGQTLEALIASEYRLAISTVIELLSQLAGALDYAHERKIVHRDVKPSNILVSSTRVWVADFGTAKSEMSTSLTTAGGLLGTPVYTAPEQAQGEEVDGRADLYSLGCILFECVTGARPFQSDSLTGLVHCIVNEPPQFPENWSELGLPEALRPILERALAKDRDDRYPSGKALIEALEAIPAEAVAEANEAREEARARSSEDTGPGGDLAEITVALDEAGESEAAERASPESSPEPDQTEAETVDTRELEAFRLDPRLLSLSSTLSDDLQGVSLSPEEGFVLSRIDGQSRPSDILSMIPISEKATARVLFELIGKKLVRLEEPPPEQADVKKEPRPPKAGKAEAQPKVKPPPPPPGVEEGPGDFDPFRYAEELYGRAMTAYDLQDFWGVIELCRQAIEHHDQKGAYFHLLARAMMQNKSWRKEAAENFRKACELEPDNVEFLGMLGALYQSEGLGARARTMLEKARALQPDYQLPVID